MVRHEEPLLFIIARSGSFFIFPRSLTTEQLYPGPLGNISHNGERLLAIRATAVEKERKTQLHGYVCRIISISYNIKLYI